jgi:GNAT superfamily N-acetyltransferase
MSEELRVRIATPEDVHQIMEMGLSANNEVAVFKANPQKLLFDVWPALHQEGGIIGVIGKPGRVIEGGIFLKITSLGYSDDLYLDERIVYVRPEFRRGGRSDEKHCHSRKLCEFAKKTSDELGIPLIMGIATSVGFQGKARMYKRFFGKQAGAFFFYGRPHHQNISDSHAVAAE